MRGGDFIMKSSIYMYILVVLIIVVGAGFIVWYFNNQSGTTSQNGDSNSRQIEPNSMKDELLQEEESMDEGY